MSILGTIGDVLGGYASADAASYQAQVARNNATIQQQNATRAASATASQTEEAGLKARSQQADVRAGLAANGTDVNSGSAADVQVGQREIGQLNTATVANNDALQVYGYETQSVNDTAQAGLEQSQVGSDILSGWLKAGGSLVGNSDVGALGQATSWMGGSNGGGSLDDIESYESGEGGVGADLLA